MTIPDDFYIGYEPQLPPTIRGAVTRVVMAACVLVIALAMAATLAQERLPDARFEYGKPQTFRGWLSNGPLPTLYVATASGETRYWLVGRRKFGAEADLAGIGDGPIELEGTVIAREHWRMLEIVPGTARQMAAQTAPPAVYEVSRHRVRLRGEVVDAKCFLGVMNPGQRNAHRDCAVRCLSGGVPMMFAYTDAQGLSHLALLLGPGGRMMREPWASSAGTRLEVTGELVHVGDEEVLIAEAP